MKKDQSILYWEGELEQYMQISQDIKKEFYYSKCEGCWYWRDRGDEEYSELQAENSKGHISPPFTTFFDALSDAVEPYLAAQEIENE